MLSTVSSNFLREVDYKKIIEAQDNMKRQSEEMSGSAMKKLSDYSYLDRKLKLNIEGSIASNILYREHNNRQILEFNVMIKSVDNLKDSALGFLDTLKLFKNSNDSEEDHHRIVELILQDVINSLNTQFGDKYLFAGDEWGIKPVDEDFKNYDLGNAFNIHEENILEATYYRGGIEAVKIQTTRNTTISYDITARDEHLAVFMNLLNAFVNHKLDDKYYIDDVIGMMEQVVIGIDGLVADVKGMNAGIEAHQNALEQENTVLQEIINDNNNFNMMKVYTELMSKNKDLETSLEMNSQIDKSRWRTDRNL